MDEILACGLDDDDEDDDDEEEEALVRLVVDPLFPVDGGFDLASHIPPSDSSLSFPPSSYLSSSLPSMSLSLPWFPPTPSSPSSVRSKTGP